MFSVTSKYALRALTNLACLEEGKALLGRDLASKASIPSSYIYRILLTLRNAGILKATRGIGGGYRLCRTPEEIYLIDVVRLFDGAKITSMCLLGEYECSGSSCPCSGHDAWGTVIQAINHFLLSTTIAAISKPPTLDLNDNIQKQGVEGAHTGEQNR